LVIALPLPLPLLLPLLPPAVVARADLFFPLNRAKWFGL
jgi:hypothetical protein